MGAGWWSTWLRPGKKKGENARSIHHSLSVSARGEKTNGATTSRPSGEGNLKATRETREAMPSRPARSTSNATTTGRSQFAPLENIGLPTRPRTATSTETSKVCFSGGAKTRQSTNVRTAKKSFVQHEAAVSCIVKPTSALPSSPQHKGSAYQPPPTKPEHLDDKVHPAYCEVLETDKNVHPRLRRYQRSGLVRETVDKHPISPRMVSSDTSGSPHRDSKPRRYEDGYQRRAAIMADLPTQGQESQKLPSTPPRLPTIESSRSDSSSNAAAIFDTSRSRSSQDSGTVTIFLETEARRTIATGDSQGQESHKLPSPELPPRPYAAESSRSNSSSSAAAIFDTSRARGSQDSDTSTMFSATGVGTTIATGEFDFAALLRLGSKFGVARPEFVWRINAEHRAFAARRKRILTTGDREQKIDAIWLLSPKIPIQNTVKAGHARKAWSLLSPNESRIRKRHITEGFCEHFLLIYHTLQSDKEVPYQVPVTTRAKIDKLYDNVSRKMKNANSPENLARWIESLDGEMQGTSLIALLEIKMHSDGLIESRELLRAILSLLGQVQSLRHASEDQISNFFATYVRGFRDRVTDGSDENTLTQSLEYFSSFWSLCTAQYSGHKADNYLSLFKGTISKLDNIDIPLGLWTFLAGSGCSNLAQDMGDPAVEQLYLAMETELNDRLPSECPSAISGFITMQFLLSIGNFGFFEVMDRLMRAQREREWLAVWQTCQHQETFTALTQLTGHYTKEFKTILALITDP